MKPLFEALDASNIPSDYGGKLPDGDTLAQVEQNRLNTFRLVGVNERMPLRHVDGTLRNVTSAFIHWF